MTPEGNNREELAVATLGGGCFWCLEAAFRQLQGVKEVVSGYSGGPVENPPYEQVCTGTTGHAEVVQITYDPQVITYPELLEVFFAIHDPTTLNRQGADVGPQYRSVIFYHTPEQKAEAEAMIRKLEVSGRWKDPIVTQLQPAQTFYPAEEYHQRYFERNPYQPYCQLVVAPKAAKVRKMFAAKLKS